MDEELVHAAEMFSDEFRLLGAHGGAPATYDLVLAVDPSERELERAKTALTRAGQIYVEFGSRFGPSIARRRQALQRLGFRDTRTHWHFPRFSPSRAIVPLDERAGFSYALSRRASAPTERLAAWTASRLGPASVAMIAPSRSLVGTLGDPDAPTGARTFVAAAARRHQLERNGMHHLLPEVLITPVAETSANVIALLLDDGTKQPTLVAKCPRLGERGGLAREAENLRAVRRVWHRAATAAPEYIGLDEQCGTPILFQTALRGRGLEPAELRRSDAHAIPAVVAALTDLAVETAHRPRRDDDWYERLLSRPLEEFARSVELGADEPDLVRRTLELVDPLREFVPPLVCEHGDVAHSNLLRLEDGRIGFLDWELADLRGLPLNDLVFFLAYAAFARSRAITTVARVAAFDAAFFRGDQWAKPLIASAAARLELPLEALTPLFVACWARYAARLPLRLLAPAGTDRMPPQTRLTEHDRAGDAVRPWLELWRYAVERAGSLDWANDAAEAR